MSGALEALTAKVEALGEKMDRNSALLEKALGSKSAASTKTETAKPATATKAAGGKAGGKGKANKPPTVAEVRTAFGKFLNEGGGERNERIAKIKSVNEHFGIKSLESLDADNTVEALGYLKQIEAGEDPSFMNEDEAAGEEESPI